MAAVNLNDRALRECLRGAVMTALNKGGIGMVGHIQKKLNVSARVGDVQSNKARRAAASRAKRRSARFLYQPSAPGEPPRKRTGWLQKFMAYEVDTRGDDVTLRVGSGLKYARHLEFGTRKMKPRPFLRPGLAEYKDRLANVVNIELRRQLG